MINSIMPPTGEDKLITMATTIGVALAGRLDTVTAGSLLVVLIMSVGIFVLQQRP